MKLADFGYAKAVNGVEREDLHTVVGTAKCSLRGICLHNKNHNLHLVLGLSYACIFPGAVYQPRHVFQNHDFGSKLCVYILRSSYWPPEVAGLSEQEANQNGGRYGKGLDLWGLGVTLFNCVTGKRAFMPEGTDRSVL